MIFSKFVLKINKVEDLYKTEQGKNEILSLYDEKLATLAIAYETHNVHTGYGITNIISTGLDSNPPILVIHGSNGCAPIALETYLGLSKAFKVYAIDVLGQPNKSAQTRLSMKDDSYGQWINEIIDLLQLENVTMAGFSFGGLVILKTLEFNERKIKAVYLSAPGYIVNGNPLKALFKIFIPMKRFVKTENIKYVERFLAQVFTERDEFAVKFLSKVFLHFKMDFTPVPVISKRKAQAIETPIFLIGAKDDILFPGVKMIKRASKIFPSLKKSLLLEKSKHVQSKKDNVIIQDIILNK